MPIFLKAGLWTKKKLGYKGELNLSALGGGPSYKVYSVILVQDNLNPPEPIVLENTIGNMAWTRTSAGRYKLTTTGVFTENKTALTRGEIYVRDLVPEPLVIYTERISDTEIIVNSSKSNIGADNIIYNDFFEIRVYE